MQERIKVPRLRKSAHAIHNCRYHIVWITKYRFKVIKENIKQALKWRIKEICDWKDIEILAGDVQEEHIHLYLRIPPKHSIANVIKWLKGKTAEKLLMRFDELKQKFWGKHLWARGYFVSTIGISDDEIRKYINNQRKREYDEYQRIWRHGG
jgi:putative transposase